jgi:hypothetical protein
MGIKLACKPTESASEKNWLSGMKIMGLVILAITGFFIFKSSPLKAQAPKNQDLKILKKEVTSTAKFYPYKVDGVKMEVIAVKASDGTVRTAFNTCQVCYDSGRGYYIQEGDELVCQNCGNRFQIDMVERIKNGCNPVPITSNLKADDGKYITISKSLMVKAKGLFGNWRKS